jgi:hypothetical protein
MRAAVAECERRLVAGVDDYVSQSWLLWKADILATAGLNEEAAQVGLQAIADYGMKLHCSTMAGPFARWLAITCIDSDLHQQAAALLLEMEEHLDDYDALDQVEILCARLQHGCDDIEEHLQALQERTGQLPESALVTLRACGIPVGF